MLREDIRLIPEDSFTNPDAEYIKTDRSQDDDWGICDLAVHRIDGKYSVCLEDEYNSKVVVIKSRFTEESAYNAMQEMIDSGWVY